MESRPLHSTLHHSCQAHVNCMHVHSSLIVVHSHVKGIPSMFALFKTGIVALYSIPCTPIVTQFVMAIDPLAWTEEDPHEPSDQPAGPPPDLTAALIRDMFSTLERPESHEEYQDARQALKKVIHASLMPCVFHLALFADFSAEEVAETGFETALLRSLFSIGQTAYAPPFSRESIMARCLEDWCIQCVASDGY